MKNIIVVGDSFTANPAGWPGQLATMLNLNLISYGVGGEHWWGVKQFLDSISMENTEAIVFAHTFGNRIPTGNKELGKHDFFNLDATDEEQLAVKLYYKYIQNDQFMDWAQCRWFEQISKTWSGTKLVNLHCFPWTWDKRYHLGGINISPSLSAISLNEIDTKEFDLINDGRSNHFNDFNNTELARQLSIIIAEYKIGEIQLDITKFRQLTTRWLDWK